MSSRCEYRKTVCKEVVKFPVEDPRKIRSAGFCFVEKEDVLNEMLDDDTIYRTQVMRADFIAADNRLRSANSVSRLGNENPRVAKSCQAVVALNDQTKKTSIYADVKTNQRQKESKYATLMEGITQSIDLLDSIDKNMSLMEETKRNKCRHQFEEWNTQVHGSIQACPQYAPLCHDDLFTFRNCPSLRKFLLLRWIFRSKSMLLIRRS